MAADPTSVWRFSQGSLSRPSLALAPMEGISDAVVRDLLAGLGGMDLCVTEFIRVVQRPLSKNVLLRSCPELLSGGRTSCGVPVMVQLLGGEPEMMAASAQVAVEAGALGIDLNFGCPAKRVNGSDGGAALLRLPVRVRTVVEACRRAVPDHIPVSAKIRLGWEDPDDVMDIAQASEDGGASWLTIHGRTKKQMYKPYADWVRIGWVKQRLSIPVVANGDIFDPESFLKCREVSGCHALMLGRGAFQTPNLFRWIRGADHQVQPVQWAANLLRTFVDRMMSQTK